MHLTRSSARTSIGTLAWARRTGGRLSRFNELTLLMQALASAFDRYARRRKAPFSADAAELRIPDSRLCVAAGELLREVSEPWLVNHCLRAFLWATILGRSARLKWDEELLFVACALHDLGLTAKIATLTPAPAQCFAVEGAFAAEAFLEREQIEASRRETIVEAIALHLNVRVPLRQGVEAHLLHEGTTLDVIGARRREIAAPAREAVLRLHPRGAMTPELVTVMQQQARSRPRARAAFLCRFGLVGLIRRAKDEG